MAQSMARSLRVSAPAKINLHLRVGPVAAADGFHPLLSWMVTVGLFDNLEFTLVDVPGIDLSCDDPAIPRASGEAVGDRPGVVAALQKRIPVGAGLGGGSSDGAFTLIALDHLLGLNWPAQRMSDFAARFGSDLSFFFHGPSSICTGRGEIVRPTPAPKPRWAVLILPGIHMATPAVYRRFDEMRLGNAESLEKTPDWRQWATLDALALLPLLVNDLEPPAFSLSPALADLHARAIRAVGRIVRMSGSGSSLFTLFDGRDQAESAADCLRLDLRVDARAVELCSAIQ
jgi:4-diphosphocytidyl-2-C-methyl-D-erythritol kinase